MSALCLGKSNRREALPTLTTMLTEFFPPHERYMSGEAADLVDYQYDLWRQYLPALFVHFNDRMAIPVLGQASLATLRVEQEGIQHLRYQPGLQETSPLSPPALVLHNQSYLKKLWRRYEEALVYALGYFGAGGIVTGLPHREENRLAGLRVQFVMGMLSTQYPQRTAYEWDETPDLQDHVLLLLEHVFGLSAQERQQAITYYEREILPSPF